MADFVREPGEVEVLRETVETAEDQRRTEGRLVLTDRRVVLLAEQHSFALRWMLGEFLGQLVEERTLAMTHQIERDDFATVEPQARGMLGFHSKGEGSARTSFLIYSRAPAGVWQRRMHQWAAGALAAAPLPGATLRRAPRPRPAR